MTLDIIRGGIIIILLVSFAGMAVWLWFFADRQQLDQAARMPLDDKDTLQGRTGQHRADQHRGVSS